MDRHLPWVVAFGAVPLADDLLVLRRIQVLKLRKGTPLTAQRTQLAQDMLIGGDVVPHRLPVEQGRRVVEDATYRLFTVVHHHGQIELRRPICPFLRVILLKQAFSFGASRCAKRLETEHHLEDRVP
ncbi:hypothetical protein D3C78_1134490 [compost metagenome]